MYYYNAPVDQAREPERYSSQQRFFASLRTVAYLEVRLGRLIYRNWPQEPPYEKGIDVKLTADMLSHCFRGICDTVVLVSGDTDFADALQAVKDNGQHVEVALVAKPGASYRLREVADRVIVLDGAFLQGCWK